MTNQELIQELINNTDNFTDQQILEIIEICKNTYNKNYRSFYESQDIAEEFLENLLNVFKHLPKDIIEKIKQRIVNL